MDARRGGGNPAGLPGTGDRLCGVQPSGAGLSHGEIQESREPAAGGLAPELAAVFRCLFKGTDVDVDFLFRDLARRNLERTTVTATVDGTVTNMELRPGDYAVAGKPLMALVDADSLHVDGYFEETKLDRVHVGDRAEVLLMGQSRPMFGRVESIAMGIADRERGLNGDLLANVNPTFNWVRLAQRIPVRIVLDEIPPDVHLVVGRTATVQIIEARPNPRKSR